MTLKKPLFSLLDHTADIGMAVRSGTLEGLFKDAAAALLHIIFERPYARGGKVRRISLKASDLTDLMVRWLGEILYIVEGEGIAPSDIGIKQISDTALEAEIKAVPLAGTGFKIKHEIKAVTYHEAIVSQDKDGWHSRVIFDL
jgi:SHS2 domain-containing protein